MATASLTTMDAPIDRIVVGERIRRLCQVHVARLADNLAVTGLIHPITVYPVNQDAASSASNGWGLVTGAHRLAAAIQLGWITIPAIVSSMGEVERVIAECDENLMGTNLGPADRALFTKTRKDAYEALHPETRQGAGGCRSRKARQLGDLCRFTADVARATGVRERLVQRDARRGALIDAGVLKAVSGTGLDKGTVLDRLARTPLEAQAGQLTAMVAARTARPERSRRAVRSWPQPTDAVQGEVESSRSKASPGAKWVVDRFGRDDAPLILDNERQDHPRSGHAGL